MPNSKLNIKKANGEIEVFDREKLRASLRRAGSSDILSSDISDQVQKQIKKNTTTQEIYSLAFKILKQQNFETAIKYSLRRSLLLLGPTGFPFEKYIGSILSKKGYQTIVGVDVKGKCINHEIDVIAYDENDLVFIETKFHNDLGFKTDTKTVLYIKARYDDLKDVEFNFGGRSLKMNSSILMTNTKFTTNAKKYASCSNVGLISWDYPKKGNLYEIIEKSRVYPLTILNNLSKNEKNKLIEMGFVTCIDIKNNPDLLKKIGIKPNKIKDIYSEIESICIK